MAPKASILIPVYNRESLIGACIDSAMTQSVQDIEIIVVDNCSTDKSWDVIQEYADRDGRIKAFRNIENVGPVRNWARCIQEARSPYGKLLFSDDMLDRRFLEKTLPLIELSEVGAVFCACQIGEQAWTGEIRYQFREAAGVWSPGAFLVGHVFAYDLPFSPGAALFRIEDLKKSLFSVDSSPNSEDFLRYGAGPDVLLFLKSESWRGAVAHVPEPLCFFRSHPESITISKRERVESLYRYTIARFVSEHRPDLLRCYLSGIRWLIGEEKATTEIHMILRELGQPTSNAPTKFEYFMDMRRRASSRLLRRLYRPKPRRPFREK